MPLGLGETAWSFASRLAAANHTDLRRFLSDVGLPLLGVVNGDSHTLAFLARLGCADPEALSRDTFIKVGAERYTLRGQGLGVASMRRRRPWFCPLCACGDVRASNGIEPWEAVYCRALWNVEHLRTCAVHHVALLDLAPRHDSPDSYDFTNTFSDDLTRLAHLQDGLRSRGMSGLERYLSRRLDAGKGGVPWLDGLAFNAAAMLVERVGLVAAFGQKAKPSSLTPNDWWVASDMGFAILETGVSGLHCFLDHIQRAFEYSTIKVEKAHAVYGSLYSWLDGVERGPELEPIRNIIREHIVNRFAVDVGTRVLGEFVKERKLHSIRSLAKEAGWHSVRLRRFLAAEGLLPAGHEGRHDSQVLIDANKVAPIITKSKDRIGTHDVKKYLGVSSIYPLMHARVLIPMAPSQNPRDGKIEFLRADVLNLLRSLTRDAVPTEVDPRRNCDIYSVVRRTRRSLPEVIKLITEGTFTWVGMVRGRSGFDAIVVRHQEVTALIRSDDVVGLTPSRLPKALQACKNTVDNLIRLGVLPVQHVRSPFKNQMVYVVTFSDIEAFKKKYVSLLLLAREKRKFPHYLMKELSELGIDPVMTADQVGSTFYLRSALP